MDFYNEMDPRAAAWLRQLIADGLIPGGRVDERDIRDIVPTELMGYRRCHFFAGIGGWAYALDLAGWPEDKPVWTGSCPCQPFSQAGRREGFADERHLWPSWFHLIEQCRPEVVYGEHVASALGWLDLVFDDLEGAGYAVRAEDLCAAGVGAPHIRQRLYWMADGICAGLEVLGEQPARQERAAAERSCAAIGMADADSGGSSARGEAAQAAGHRCAALADGGACRAGPTDGFWRDVDWLGCRDGRWRPVEPGTSPLAHRPSGRVGLLRGYGNAIVPQVAAAFIEGGMRHGKA